MISGELKLFPCIVIQVRARWFVHSTSQLHRQLTYIVYREASTGGSSVYMIHDNIDMKYMFAIIDIKCLFHIRLVSAENQSKHS